MGGEKEHFLKWLVQVWTPPIKKMKLYTIGQIAKLHHVPLSEVYKWRQLLIHEKIMKGGRGSGYERIENDPHGRWGYPESWVKVFPKAPKKQDE